MQETFNEAPLDHPLSFRKRDVEFVANFHRAEKA